MKCPQCGDDHEVEAAAAKLAEENADEIAEIIDLFTVTFPLERYPLAPDVVAAFARAANRTRDPLTVAVFDSLTRIVADDVLTEKTPTARA